jgi:DNA-binding transcriptional regulator LsrR (DeoR family)
MAKNTPHTKLLMKIATAYYEDGLTQKQIGQRLSVSRIKVSRLLREAREEGIVQITIASREDASIEVEHELETRFGLDEVFLAHPPSYDAPTLLAALGAAAAHCLNRRLQGYETLTLTWGRTLLSVISALSDQDWPHMRVVQALGGLGNPDADVYGVDLLHRTAQTLGAKARILPSPGIVSSRQVRDALLTDPQIANTLALAARADIALIGIGRPDRDSIVTRSAILTEVEREELQSLAAVGDIGLRFFDAQGSTIEHEINDRIVGLTLKQITEIPSVIGVAGGSEKFDAIRAAVRGGLINVLVTDDRTGRRLLDDSPQYSATKPR